jgi:hypothetical protein
MYDHRNGADPSDEFSKFAVGPKVSPGFQAMLKASSDAAVRPVFAELSRKLLGAGLSKSYLGEFSKLAAWPKMRAAIDVPAGRTLSERARFSDLLGQVGELPPAGTDGQATLADFAQLQAERRAAHEADQAILDLRDQFEQLVTIMQVV